MLLVITLNFLLTTTLFATPSRGNDLVTQIKQAVAVGQLDSAKSLAFELLKKSQSTQNDSLEAAAYYWIGNTFHESENHSVASTYYQRAIEIADLHNFVSLHARTLTAYGWMLASVNEVSLAQSNIDLSIKLASEIEDEVLIAANYMHLSYIGFVRNDFESELKYAALALDIGRRLQDTNLIARAYQNMGSATYSMENYEIAEEYLRASAEYYLKVGNHDKFCLVYLDLMRLTIDRGWPHDWHEVFAEFKNTVAAKGVAVPEKYLWEVSEMQERDVATLQNDNLWLRGIGITVSLVLAAFVVWFIIFASRQKKITANLKIEVSFKDSVAPLYNRKDNNLIITYVLVAFGFSQRRIAAALNKDRSTIAHWVTEIKTLLGVDDIETHVKNKHYRSSDILEAITELDNPVTRDV